MEWWQILSTVINGVLAVAAIVAGVYAYKNLRVLRERRRYDILVSLINQINDKHERRNRATIHKTWKTKRWEEKGRNDVGKQILDLMDRVWKAQEERTEPDREDVEIKDAIEETVACLDKVGFFLMKGNSKIQNEAPIQIWSIADDMWKKMGSFVEKRHKRREVWGTYFEELGHEAEVKMSEWRKSKKGKE